MFDKQGCMYGFITDPVGFVMETKWGHHLVYFFKSIARPIFHYILNIATLLESLLSLYFRFCHLSPSTVDLDGYTTMHFWTTNHRRFHKPNLVLIHGYGGNCMWQFCRQVGPLSRHFNLYIPDLLFFGKSYTEDKNRTIEFQANCVCKGLKKLGVDKFSLYAISYGGYVGYHIAQICEEIVEKVVIVSSGIGCTEELKQEQLSKLDENPLDLLIPKNPQHLRLLVRLSIHKFDLCKWVPDLILRQFVQVNSTKYTREKEELVVHLLHKRMDFDLPIINQETLLIWGDKDKIFPLPMAYNLQGQLGPKSKLVIIEETGHAVNIESSDVLNELITSFLLTASCSNKRRGRES